MDLFFNFLSGILQDSSEEPEVLGSESSADYVWDDLMLPHKLVVRINGNILQCR